MFIICVRRHYNKNAHAINGDKLNPCAVPFKKTKQSSALHLNILTKALTRIHSDVHYSLSAE